MNKFSWELFEAMPVVGIVRNLPAATIEKVATLYADAGFTTIEITLNTAEALEMIHDLNKKLGGRLNIGAGTVCSVEELDLAISAGSSFIVTPIINEAVIKKCVDNQVTIFPGAYTPSEIYKAWSMGAKMIKVFPATKLGVDYIKEVLAPLNKVRLMPTGGVSLENCESFFRAGAVGVGMGSNLFPKDIIADGRWEDLSVIFERYAHVLGKMQSVTSASI